MVIIIPSFISSALFHFTLIWAIGNGRVYGWFVCPAFEIDEDGLVYFFLPVEVCLSEAVVVFAGGGGFMDEGILVFF